MVYASEWAVEVHASHKKSWHVADPKLQPCFKSHHSLLDSVFPVLQTAEFKT